MDMRFLKIHVNYIKPGVNEPDEFGRTGPKVFGFITYGVNERSLTLNAIRIARKLGGSILSYGERHDVEYEEQL